MDYFGSLPSEMIFFVSIGGLILLLASFFFVKRRKDRVSHKNNLLKKESSQQIDLTSNALGNHQNLQEKKTDDCLDML